MYLCFLDAFGAAVVAAGVDVADKHVLDTSMNIHVGLTHNARKSYENAIFVSFFCS